MFYYICTLKKYVTFGRIRKQSVTKPGTISTVEIFPNFLSNLKTLIFNKIPFARCQFDI